MVLIKIIFLEACNLTAMASSVYVKLVFSEQVSQWLPGLEAYSESWQTSKAKRFAKIIDG